MFLGHFAVALLAKRAVPAASLGLLVAAAQLPDLVWPIFVLIGWERLEVAPGDTAVTPLAFVHYPWSHSLLLVLLWAAAGALLLRISGRPRPIALAAAVLVVSHWVLDFVAHRPDLPLYPGGPVAGLGLWHSVPATLAVELGLFATGILAVLGSVLRPARVGRLAVGMFLGLLLAIYIANVVGPPPPSARVVVWLALALWLLVPWAVWLDRRRHEAVDETGPARHT